jgi:hypothetical protein
MNWLTVAAVANPGNAALTQAIISVASGLTVVVLSYLTRSFRKLLKEHDWLIKTVNQNAEAIRILLEERNGTDAYTRRRR